MAETSRRSPATGEPLTLPELNGIISQIEAKGFRNGLQSLAHARWGEVLDGLARLRDYLKGHDGAQFIPESAVILGDNMTVYSDVLERCNPASAIAKKARQGSIARPIHYQENLKFNSASSPRPSYLRGAASCDLFDRADQQRRDT